MFNPKKDSWKINEDDFPAKGGVQAKWRFLLQYAVLAPSTRNTQPWRFVLNADALELYADHSRAIGAIDPGGRELVMSCGAALFLLRVAAERFECAVEVSLFPRYGEHDFLARIEMQPGKGIVRELRDLFPAIHNRHTQRMPFDGRKLPEELVRQLEIDAHAEGVIFASLEGEELRKTIAKLVAAGDIQQAGSATFRQQLAGLFRSNLSVRRDGMPGYSHGLGWLRSLLMSGLVEKKGWGEDVARDDFMAVMCAPCFAVLMTAKDTQFDWLSAGQALARVLLRACNAGVSASFMGQATEIPALREHLQEALNAKSFPQIMLRMGYGAEAEATPRRPVRAVMSKLRL